MQEEHRDQDEDVKAVIETLTVAVAGPYLKADAFTLSLLNPHGLGHFRVF
jgi:hypothetical protein